jgi:hypothetical protein
MCRKALVIFAIKMVPNDKGNPLGKLADAELHFSEGPLAGLNRSASRSGKGGSAVATSRSRPGQYSVNGERRSFALLRPIADVAAQERLRESLLAAYAEFERQIAEAVGAPRASSTDRSSPSYSSQQWRSRA